MKQLYIVRNPFNVFEAGELVMAVAPSLGGKTEVHSVGRALPVVTMITGGLLPRTRFLLNKPRYHFWALRRKYNDEYLSDPSGAKPVYGDKPFHFESLGELVFYLGRINHDPADYLIGNYNHRPDLKPRKHYESAA